MDILGKSRAAYMPAIYISTLYVNLAIRSSLLGRNDRMGIFYAVFIIMAAAIIMAVYKNRMGFLDVSFFALLITGGFYTAVRCSKNQFYFISVLITIVLLFLFIRYKVKNMDYIMTPSELFKVKIFILKIMHFLYMLSLLFMGIESVTAFSIGLSVITISFVFIMRCYIFKGMYSTIISGTIIEMLASIFAVIIMPWNPSDGIVAFQMENTAQSFINVFLCTLLLSLLEIPFNPIWSFEKNVKG